MNKSEWFLGLFIAGFVILLSISFFLNIIVSSNMNLSEFLDTMKTQKSGNIISKETDMGKVTNFIFKRDNKLFDIEVNLNEETYELFKNLPRKNDYSYYINFDKYIMSGTGKEMEEIVFQIISIAKEKEYSRLEIANIVLSFVQTIRSENNNLIGAKFPYETIYEEMGNCKDTVILASYILNKVGFRTIILEFEDHVGIGINVEANGKKYIYNENEYYYGETTGGNFRVGEISELYYNESPKIFLTTTDLIIDFKWDLESREINKTHNNYRINMSLNNLGEKNTIAEIKTTIKYYNQTIPEEKNTKVINVDGKSSINILKNINFQKDKTHKINIEINGREFNLIKQETEWITS